MTTTNGSVSNGKQPATAEPTANSNSKDTTQNPILNDRMYELVSNALMARTEFFKKFMDPRRSIDDECGYPVSVSSYSGEQYQDLYDREPIATRVVQLLPKECWQVTPLVYEDEDTSTVTPFEKAWDELAQQLRGDKSWYQDEEGSPIWEYLCRIDILSGIGSFGILLLGINDGKQLWEPIDEVGEDGNPKDSTGVSGGTPSQTSRDIYGGAMPTTQPISGIGTDAQYFRTQFTPGTAGSAGVGPKKKSGPPKLLFLRVFPEHLVQVVQYEADVTNPRFGMPVMYLVTLNDPRQQHTGVGLPLATVRVHWSRVIHVSDTSNASSSEIFSPPRMRPVLNSILDIRKVKGASAEGYWKSCFTGLALSTHPQLGGEVQVDETKLKNMMENYMNGLDRYLALMGMSANTLAPSVVDPTPHIEMQISNICIQLGCPVRVFKGSERGELASSQDDSAWNDRLKHRQNNYITPRIIVPFIDRLIAIGVLPEPTVGKTPKPDKGSELKPKVPMLTPAPIPTSPSKAPPPKPEEPPPVMPGMKPAGSIPMPNAQGAGAPIAKAPMPKPVGNIRKPSRRYQTILVYNADADNGRGGMEERQVEVKTPTSSTSPKKTKGGYSIEWPDLDSLSEKDKAAIALQETQALAAYVSGGIEAMLPPMDYYTRILHWDEEEAIQVVFDASAAIEEKQQEAADMAGEHEMEPEAPEGFEKKPPPPPPMPGIPGGPPIAEEKPTQPVKMNPGQSLVHPETGKTVAKTADKSKD